MTANDPNRDTSPGTVAAWTAHLPAHRDTSAALPVVRPDRLPQVWPGPPGTHTTHRHERTTTTGAGLDLPHVRGHDRDDRDGLGVDWTESRILLGPDWKAIAGFTTFVASLVGGAVLGEVAASSTGGLAGAMTAAGLFGAVQLVRNWRRLPGLSDVPAGWPDDHPTAAATNTAGAFAVSDGMDSFSGNGFDSVRSTGWPAPARSERASVPVFVWVCGDCDLRSTPVVTWVEARHLALTHDRVHHGTRPAAAIESQQVSAHLLLNAGSSWLTASALSARPGLARRPALGRGSSGDRR